MEKGIEQTIKGLYTKNLCVQPGDTVLVFTDRIKAGSVVSPEEKKNREDLIEIVGLISRSAPDGVKVKKVIYDTTGGHGIEPPEPLWIAAFGEDAVDGLKDSGLWDRLVKKQIDENQIARAKEIVAQKGIGYVQAVVGLSYYSTSHTRFRDIINSVSKTKYASMPLFDVSMFSSSMTADWDKVAELTNTIADLFRQAERVEINAPNGTDLKMGLRGVPIHEDNGILKEPGSFSNLPAGEMFLPPEAGTTEGKLVIEWAPTFRLKNPVTLFIEKGEVKDISGKDPYAEELQRILAKDRNFRNIAELGLGTNSQARRPDNILESEKILGTIHVALGDNASFGGHVKVPFHQDYIVFQPYVTLIFQGGDKRQILTKGRLKDVYRD